MGQKKGILLGYVHGIELRCFMATKPRTGWWARATPLKNMTSSIKGWLDIPNSFLGKCQKFMATSPHHPDIHIIHVLSTYYPLVLSIRLIPPPKKSETIYHL